MKIHLKKKKQTNKQTNKLNHSKENREMGGSDGLRFGEDSVGVGLIGGREEWAEAWVGDVDRRLGA